MARPPGPDRVGPKQQPVLEGGWLPLGGIAHRIAGASTDRPDRPPFVPGGESCPAAAAEPASCYLLDHRDGPGGQGGLEPASSSGGLVFTKGSRDQVQKGHGGSLRLPSRFLSGPSSRSSSPVTARPNPVSLLLVGATATLVHQDRPGRLIREGHGLSAVSKVEPGEEAGVARRRESGGRSRRPHWLLI